MKLINKYCLLLMWKKIQANAIGRSAKTVREFLEKNYTDEAITGDNEAIKLAIKALLEVSSHGLCDGTGAYIKTMLCDTATRLSHCTIHTII